MDPKSMNKGPNEKYLLKNEETERLFFRKFEQSDFDEWLPFYQDPTSTQFWEGLPQDPIEACEEQFERLFERYEKNLGGMNALILKASGRLVGMAGLLKQTVDNVQELEIGYSILPEYRKTDSPLRRPLDVSAMHFKTNWQTH